MNKSSFRPTEFVSPEMATRLTDAGHTAIGFAAMAAKQLNDSRLDLNARFEPQVREARSNAFSALKGLREGRTQLSQLIDPVVDRIVEQLPGKLQENVADTVVELRKVANSAVDAMHTRVADVIEFATAIPATPKRKPATTPDVEPKPVAKKSQAQAKAKKEPQVKPASKKTAAKKTVKTTTARKPGTSRRAA